MTELEEQLYAKGVDVKALMENATVTQAIEDISSALKDAMAATNPAEADKREAYYYTHRGLLELVALLNNYMAVKEQLDADIEAQDDLFADD